MDSLYCCLFLVLIIGNFGLSTEWIVRDEELCHTPDHNPGTCITIKSCKFITDILENASLPISDEIRDMLRSYQCGYDGRRVKVCCPNEDTAITPTSTEVVDVVVDETDVTQHPMLSLLPQDCGLLNTDNKIIGGNLTSLTEYPWMALLSYRKGETVEFRCGGSVINENYILTAAHCVANLGKLELIGVRVGEHNITSERDCEMIALGREVCAEPVQDFPIEKVIFHPEFNVKTLQNDIAVIRVKGAINFNPENVKPICLPTTKPLREFSLEKQKLTVTGWGATETGPKSNVLLQVRIPVRNHEECTSIYKSQVPIWHKQICAGGINQMDSCGGDSGGPLQILGDYNDDTRYIQYGIVSFGPKLCGVLTNPGVYTSVVQYNKWILDNMEI